MIDFDHPANLGLVQYLSAEAALGAEREAPSTAVKNPYYTLGTHPDVVERLWDELGGALPKNCRWVLYGHPVLVRHDTGIVFGFAGGSHTYALRLPPAEREAAIAAGATTVHRYPAYPQLQVAAATLDLATFGPEWVFGGWFRNEEEWCRRAFDLAAA